MSNVLCFISSDFADFEITLAFHKIKTVGKYNVITVAYTREAVISESGLSYLPDMTIEEAMNLDHVEALIIPGGPIREQGEELSRLIHKTNEEGKLIAAICNGPQYLGRAGLLKDLHFTTSCSVERIQKLGVDDPFPRENYMDKRIVKSGNVITAQGRAFVDFAFALFDALKVYEGKMEQQEQLYLDIMDRN